VGFWSRLLAPSERVAGYPTSANGASSLHLHWQLPSGTGPVVAAGVQLCVEGAPEVDELYFWALQVSFRDAAAWHHGGAHLGLQWNPRHPGCRAANWGGYAPSGRILDGSASPLPSTPDDRNTRDLWWEPGRTVALRVSRAAGSDGWTGSVDGVAVRTLHAGGDRLDGLMVWSEVFARCDDPPVTACWSGFYAETADGEIVAPDAVGVNYQRRTAGGCDNTTAVSVGDGQVRQVTGTERQVPQGTRLPLH
jgi:hypothetical protein